MLLEKRRIFKNGITSCCNKTFLYKKKNLLHLSVAILRYLNVDIHKIYQRFL